MTAAEYLEENSDWFDKSPGGEKLYFESEVIKMMEKYSSQTEISDKEYYKEVFLDGYEQINQNNPVTRGSTALIRVSKPTSSQTEISDEEIFYQKQVMNPYPSNEHSYTAWEKGFMDCAKWYREQIKKK